MPSFFKDSTPKATKAEDSEWSRSVLRRDGTCRWVVSGHRCGGTTGLSAHHGIPRAVQWARLDPANGIALCWECHVPKAEQDRNWKWGKEDQRSRWWLALGGWQPYGETLMTPGLFRAHLEEGTYPGAKLWLTKSEIDYTNGTLTWDVGAGVLMTVGIDTLPPKVWENPERGSGAELTATQEEGLQIVKYL